MKSASIFELDDDDLESRCDRRAIVRAWRAEQLRRLGLARWCAEMVADAVDWHELAAALVGRGCPPLLALEIVR